MGFFHRTFSKEEYFVTLIFVSRTENKRSYNRLRKQFYDREYHQLRQIVIFSGIFWIRHCWSPNSTKSFINLTVKYKTKDKSLIFSNIVKYHCFPDSYLTLKNFLRLAPMAFCFLGSEHGIIFSFSLLNR